MRIAVTGEGPTDYGRHDFRTGNWEWGPVAAYIHNIANSEGKSVELTPIKREEIKELKLQGRSTKGLTGKAISARKFAVLMQKESCDAGIYFCDSDRETGSNNSNVKATQKHYDEVYDQVKVGLEPVNAIPMIAMRMIECWIMSDKKALEKVFGIKLKENVIPTYPEMIWGDKHNPNSNYPKHYFNRMIRQSDKRHKDYENDAPSFCEIAEASDVSTLRKKCSYSYERFYNDLVGIL